jgi:hypothetical protein
MASVAPTLTAPEEHAFVDPGPDTPLQFGPRIRLRSPNEYNERVFISAKPPSPSTTNVVVRTGTRIYGWIALGVIAPALATAAAAMLSPVFRASSPFPSRDISQPITETRPITGTSAIPATRHAGQVYDDVKIAPFGPDADRFDNGLRSNAPLLQLRSIAARGSLWPLIEPRASVESEKSLSIERRLSAVESERDKLSAEVNSLKRAQGSKTASVAAPALPSPAGKSNPTAPAAGRLPQGMPPRVQIRYAASSAEARMRAKDLETALANQGVDVAELRETVVPIATRLSFFYAPDEAAASRIGRTAGLRPTLQVAARGALLPRPGTVEILLAAR